MIDKYILKNEKIYPCNDLMLWGEWMNNPEDRRIGVDEIEDIKISTVFLGMDHGFGNGTPILFETMIFGGPLDSDMARYETIEQARNGHILAKITMYSLVVLKGLSWRNAKKSIPSEMYLCGYKRQKDFRQYFGKLKRK